MTVRCPICGADHLRELWSIHDVPVHDVQLMRSRDEAETCPRGDITATGCLECGYVFNACFQSELMLYTQEYESTQSFSPTFDTFHRTLANELMAEYQLADKDVVEVGCGNGEFLSLLHGLGAVRCTGFDPAYTGPAQPDGFAVVQDRFYTDHPLSQADFYICKMTLEHIANPIPFLAAIRAAAHDDSVIYCQVPDATRILEHGIFWDIYYEHCNYFTRESLSAAFGRAGWHVADIRTGYDGQYLMLTAMADQTDKSRGVAGTHGIDQRAQAEQFKHQVTQQVRYWSELVHRTERPVLWGGGSKAVAFLSALQVDEQLVGGRVEFVVDINPRRQETYLPGIAQKIIAPAALSGIQPDLVLIMNPVYEREIRESIRSLGIAPRIVALEDEVALHGR